MPEYIKRSYFRSVSLISSCFISHLALAKPPAVDDLWKLVQQQQKQIEQQQKQLQTQTEIVLELKAQLQQTHAATQMKSGNQTDPATVAGKTRQQTPEPSGDDEASDVDASAAVAPAPVAVKAVETHADDSAANPQVTTNNLLGGDDDILDKPTTPAVKTAEAGAPAEPKSTVNNTQNTVKGGDDDYQQDKDNKGLFYTGYAVANYVNNAWETNPKQRDQLDLERAALIGRYYFADKWSLQAEVEFEHGGTGSSMEFDVFEEFGEFEQEIEKAGEVSLEELFLQYQYEPWLAVRVGQIPVPVGLINKRHRPSHYFTTSRSESESAMIPVAWYELGVELRGRFESLKYQFQVISGLDSTGFSSANWVQPGFQNRFEMKNANDLAYVASVDYNLYPEMQIGASFYYGNTTGNRPKEDMSEAAILKIGSLHGIYERGPWIIRATGLYGNLSNSDLVSAANKRLSNNLNVKRTPVGAAALAWNMEAGYDLFELFKYVHQSNPIPGLRFDWFVRYDNYDTMQAVTGQVFDNPRWARETWTTGFNYHFNRYAMVKGHYSHRRLDLSDNNIEKMYSLGLGIEF